MLKSSVLAITLSFGLAVTAQAGPMDVWASENMSAEPLNLTLVTEFHSFFHNWIKSRCDDLAGSPGVGAMPSDSSANIEFLLSDRSERVLFSFKGNHLKAIRIDYSEAAEVWFTVFAPAMGLAYPGQAKGADDWQKQTCSILDVVLTGSDSEIDALLVGLPVFAELD